MRVAACSVCCHKVPGVWLRDPNLSASQLQCDATSEGCPLTSVINIDPVSWIRLEFQDSSSNSRNLLVNSYPFPRCHLGRLSQENSGGLQNHSPPPYVPRGGCLLLPSTSFTFLLHCFLHLSKTLVVSEFLLCWICQCAFLL